MVLSKFPMPGRPTNLVKSKAGACCTSSRAGGDCLDIFSLVYQFSLLSFSLVDYPI